MKRSLLIRFPLVSIIYPFHILKKKMLTVALICNEITVIFCQSFLDFSTVTTNKISKHDMLLVKLWTWYLYFSRLQPCQLLGGALTFILVYFITILASYFEYFKTFMYCTILLLVTLNL